MRPGPKIQHHRHKPCRTKYCKHTVKVKTNSLYYRPKRSSNKIQILQMKFNFEKKNEFDIHTRNGKLQLLTRC